MITFIRVRPAPRTVHELWASSRRREGATVAEGEMLTAADISELLRGGLLPVSHGLGDADPAAWVAGPQTALRLAAAGVPGWRITILNRGRREDVLDALARSQAAFLRVRRRDVADAAALASLPGVAPRVSVFVDSVDAATAAVAAGADDLLLRAWSSDSIGELRDALDQRLVERTAFQLQVGLDDLRDQLSGDAFTAYLRQVDTLGAVRPRYGWAPGHGLDPPVPLARLSAQWTDSAWIAGRSPDELDGAGSLQPILERALAGSPPEPSEVEALFGARGDQVDAVAYAADRLREAKVGDTVTYVVNRNINYTNQCYFRCGFCAFSKGPRSLNLRGEPYLLELHEVAHRAKEAWDRGATEVCLQGGIHPEFTGDFYVGVLEAIKSVAPEMHCHGFTPLEVWQGAATTGVSVAEFLARLKDAGLDTLPGTAAEILDDRIRRHLCPDKIRTSQWADVMTTAHEMGLRSTATVMFGHIDDHRSWANHYEVLRTIQRRTGGITEFVPLPFVHMGAPIYLRGLSRPGPTWDEVVLIHAVARLAFDGLIPNVQASWVKLGLDGAVRLLHAGCNDLGGTLMDENISRAAGAAHGQLATPADLEGVARSAGRVPARRNTLYETIGTAPARAR